MLQIVMHPKRISLLVMVVIAAFAIWAGCQTAKSSDPGPATENVPAVSNAPDTMSWAERFKSDPNNPRIAFATALLLGQFQYLQRPLDTELSERFFDEYINSLDPRHENFLQTDLDDFNIYRTNLDLLTTGGRGIADLTPAYAIYQRYMERSRQHADYVDQLLKKDDFTFTSDDTIQVDRRHEPFPADLNAAKALWKQRLRYEYLQEKLAQEVSETNGMLTVNLPAGVATNIIDTLTRRYHWSLHITTNMDGDAILQAYLESLAHAYDPHSDYFSAPHAQDFSIDMSLSLYGIGAQLQEDYGYCTIKDLVPGGPAAKSKLLNPEDRIVAVAQGNKPPVDVVDMDLEKVVQLIRGPKNTEVRLTISPAADRSSRHVVTLTRDEIKLENMESKAQLIVLPDGKRLGVLDVPSFYAPVGSSGGQSYVSADVATLIKKLKKEKVDGIIMDLRSNPGGSLEEAVRLTGLFIKDGPVVLARDSDGQVAVDSVPDPGVLYDGPLMVMINRYSASASEITAAALQDYGRAIVVGDISTHGKGTVQSLNSLRPYIWPATPSATNDPGTLKITKGKFYRITGASTQLKGVESDIVLPDLLDHSPYVGETSLDYPLPWDTIDPVEFNKLDLVQPYLHELRSLSAARLATNQDFAYIRQDIAEYEKQHEDKTDTINEADAIKERERVFTQSKERDNERQARPVPETKIYEITVQNAGDEGLPAPVSYFTTNAVTASDPRNTPVSYYSFDSNFSNYFALPGKLATVSTQGTNVVATWTNVSDLKLPAYAATLSGLSHDGDTLSVTNPVELDRIPPDAALDETERILVDYISLLSTNSVQVAVH
jgi:carboxyl-terminal processing protease